MIRYRCKIFPGTNTLSLHVKILARDREIKKTEKINGPQFFKIIFLCVCLFLFLCFHELTLHVKKQVCRSNENLKKHEENGKKKLCPKAAPIQKLVSHHHFLKKSNEACAFKKNKHFWYLFGAKSTNMHDSSKSKDLGVFTILRYQIQTYLGSGV